MEQLWQRTSLDIHDCYSVDVKDYLHSKQAEHYNTLFVEGSGGIWTLPGTEIFKQEWIDYIKNDFNLDIHTVNTFMRHPHYQHPTAHNDIYEYDGKIITHCGAINWTLEEDDADMVWYDWPEGVGPDTLDVEFRSDKDMNFNVPIEDCKELGRCRIGQTPTLVNTGVLHSVEMRERLRILLSVRFTWVVSWEDHLNSFNKVLVH